MQLYVPLLGFTQQSTEIRRTALGEDHPDFATSLNNLAELYRAMGRYEEAEPLYKQSLEITRTALGEDHPDFAISLWSMATLQTSLKRFSEAEPMHKRSLLILRRALGEDHPDTIKCQEQYDILRSKLSGDRPPTSDNG